MKRRTHISGCAGWNQAMQGRLAAHVVAAASAKGCAFDSRLVFAAEILFDVGMIIGHCIVGIAG